MVTTTLPPPAPPSGRRRPAVAEGAAGSRANPTLLDALFIVFTSVTLLLLLLWVVTSLAGQAQFATLPDWLEQMVSQVWVKISMLGGSVGLFALRKIVDKSPSPNYLLWIPGFLLFLMAVLVALSMLVRTIRKPDGPVTLRVPLRFSTDKAADPELFMRGLPVLKFWMETPEHIDPHGLFRDIDPRYPYSDTLSVGEVEGARAYIEMLGSASHVEGPGKDYDYSICLGANRARPNAASAIKAFLSCRTGTCTPVPAEDPGYLVGVDCGRSASANAGVMPVLFAEQRQEKLREAGWVVPSLETLSKMTDRERVGYTRFEVRFTVNARAKEADHYYFALRVNDQPVYIDGLLPERTRYVLQASENRLAFALENLNFAGQYDGHERLELTLYFLKGVGVVGKQDVTRDYVALRPAPEVSIPTDVGTFVWSGSYVVPRNENQYEVLLGSSTSAAPAVTAKARFDNSKFSFGGRPLVMVIRPPLEKKHNPNYGLALGIVQPTSQVQFTLNAGETRALCQWAADQVRATGGHGEIRKDFMAYLIAAERPILCDRVPVS